MERYYRDDEYYGRGHRPDRERFENRYGHDAQRQHSGRHRDFDRQQDARNYRHRDYDMERDYYESVSSSRHELDDIRQGYGFPGFGSASREDDYVERMKRERQAQRMQGYGSGRIGGYSGAAFGGSNYSSHGGYGGAPEYGAMSGRGGNAGYGASSSGYGGSHPDDRYDNYDKRRDRW